MNATKRYIAVIVEPEFNAEEWWDALRATYPNFAKALERHNHAVIEASLWAPLAALTAFGDGDAHAPTALIDGGSEGDQWADVVGGAHRVFDELS